MPYGVGASPMSGGPPPPPPQRMTMLIDRHLVSRLFFFATLVFLLYQIGLIFWPFLTTLMAAATLVFIFQPVQRHINRWCRGNASLSAAIGTFLLLLLIILPTLAAIWLLAEEAKNAIPVLKAWVQRFQEGGAESVAAALPPSIQGLIEDVSGIVDQWGVDTQGLVETGLEKLGTVASGLGGAFVGNILSVVLNTALLGIAAFFFLRDGHRWLRTTMEIVPLEKKHVERIVTRLDETLSAVVRGQFVTALVQGILATIGYAVAGLPNAMLLGVATMFMSLIPLVGAAGVWVPAAIYLLFVGPTWAGIFLATWGVLGISLVDNFLKPILIGDKARIPVFMLLFGILGGLQVYGLLGIIVGPLMIGLLLTFVGIYREEMQATPAAPVAPGPPATEPPPANE